jgi:hypothetical protein
VQALYLLWNQDISGNSAPSAAQVTGLAVALRADFAAVEAQFALVDDPDGSIAKNLMTLVYGTAATDFFFGLIDATMVTAVPCAAAQPTLAQPIIDASGGRLAYDDLRKELSFAGVLDSTTQIDQAITANGNDPALHAALSNLATASQKAVAPFFTEYPELHPLYTAYVAGTGTVQVRNTTLLAAFLPALKDKRKEEQALASVTAAAGTDPSFATALLRDATLLHAAAAPGATASADLTRIDAQGLAAAFFFGNNPGNPPDQTIDAASSLRYAPATANTLPPGPGGGPIAGLWTGYLDVPQDGFYNIAVTADAGATVTLEIGGVAVPMAVAGATWSNQAAIALTAGVPAVIRLLATSLKTIFEVEWQSQGLGWQVIPQQYLYSATLVARLRTTYIRFLKAASLATTLSLGADEIAWLAAAARLSVATTDRTDTLAGGAGVVVVTPVSMANIRVGSVLTIDAGAAAETVTVTAVTATTFSAVITKAHNGTGTPFPIVDQAFGGIGWLNALPVSGGTDAVTGAALGQVLTMLLDFARIKEALSPADERLLAVFQNPAATLADGSLALFALTGWAQDSVQALVQHFFGTTGLDPLAGVAAFARVFDAYAVVNTTRVSAAALITGITNEPSAPAVASFQSALRALYAEADWLTVVPPINDALRIAERDALVAYILQQFGDGNGQAPVAATTATATPAGSTAITLASATGILAGMAASGPGIAPGTAVTAVAGNTVTFGTATTAAVPAGSSLSFVVDTSSINTADKLFEFFLIDVETQPPVETSRIRLALSTVQLFIERVLRNLEPQVQPADLATLASQWPWMKRYRVWQANREVFLWPENWLYPELRDDQSPLFKQVMSALLQGDIDQDAAASAYLDYLTGLEEVAKLEPCGLYYQPATEETAAGAPESAYVVARTAGAHRKYYFRELQYGAWSPWTQVNIDCEDMPLTPVVWNGRLFLFWLKVLKNNPAQAPSFGSVSSPETTAIGSITLSELQSGVQANLQAQQQVAVQAVLCWSEYYNGKWQPTKTSEISRPTGLGTFDTDGPGAIEAQRNLMRISPVTLTGPGLAAIPPGPLILAVGSPLASFWPSGGFVLYNTYSLPVRFEDISVPISLGSLGSHHGLIRPLISFVAVPATGRDLSPIEPYSGGSATATFGVAYWISNSGTKTMNFTNQLIGFDWIPRYVEPQLGLDDAWDAPFFYEDRQHLFYVSTSETVRTLNLFNGFGTLFAGVSPAPAPVPLVVKQPVPLSPPAEAAIVTGNAIGGGNPVAIQIFLTGATMLQAALGDADPVTYQGRLIYPTGSASAPVPSTPTPGEGE